MFVNANDMCVIFRVDAGSDIGLGHLMRCFAVAQGLHSRHVRVIFAIRKASLSHCQSRVDWVGEIHFLSSSSAQEEQKELAELCANERANWLLLDGYQFDFGYRCSLALKNTKLAMFDDGQLLEANAIDTQLSMIINWANGAETLSYERLVPHAHCCTGDNYRVLRQEFYHAAELPFEARSRLIIMFGGSDPSEMTLPLLQRLQASAIRLPLTIVTGSGYQHVDELKKLITLSHLSIEHFHDCQQVAKVFQQGRLVISAAGASQFELLHCAAPSILVVTAANQLFASEQASKQGWCFVSVDSELSQKNSDTVEAKIKEPLIEQIVQKATALWHQPEQLQAMHNNAISVRQQNGLDNIYAALCSASGLRGDSL